ncbi:hypothetical protein DICSQDRAFT_179338 [Dichomitus squalens LYAD-421 SS1]|uniref:Uncharacterized protein n=1 Tax=Dichomitus squalens TaxID=114155 RepID=A0A4Q9Q5S8_9APHY|nr:uncharacterized protein DICSQDRAFT_179338 [Dichomitus squalens LYAD-421 SS1]EJF63361.1 hypothetical protein DICSQDRAFT_179338 [Dichomitus squalens LYAD-421 SS1]TBU62381.1 hypothetical protein BD310DRAFT_811403 [Dichomitus squalens]
MRPISEGEATELYPDSFRARLIIDYLNRQLEANHASARLKRINQESFPEHDQDSLSHAWESYVCQPKGRSNSVFRLKFGKPALRFICDHDALLELTVQEVISEHGSVPHLSASLAGMKFAFRFTTTRRTIVGNDFKVGDHESRIHLLVCDFDHAKLVPVRDDDIMAQSELEGLLGPYLQALQHGGHHVLFFPPEFVGLDYSHPPRLSLAGDYEELRRTYGAGLTADVEGFSETTINAHLSLTWGACVFAAQERRSPLKWNSSSYLAEYQTWLFQDFQPQAGWHASMKFREPRVTVLCAREIVLHFTLSGVRFYEAWAFPRGPPEEKEEWDNEESLEIALIVDVRAVSEDLEILAETARYSEEFSVITGLRVEYAQACWDSLVEFFLRQYIKLFASRRITYRFRDDYSVIRSRSLDDGSWWMLERESGASVSVFSSTVRFTKMEGFDVIVGITQTSINNQFTRLFKLYSRDISSRDEADYQVEIKTITVRLLQSRAFQEPWDEDWDRPEDEDGIDAVTTKVSQARAIVTIHISSGALHSWLDDDLMVISRPDHISGKVGEWRLAFEVDLAMRNNDELFEQRYRHQPFAYPSPPGEDPYTIRHVYLDLQNARFSARYSTMEDWEYGIPDVIRARMTLAKFIKEDYFPALVEKGIHIVSSVPIFESGGAPAFYKLTDMTCCTYAVQSKASVRADGEDATSYSEQLLFILGMTGHRSLPDITSFTPSTKWLLRGRFSQGTLAISRRVFHDRLHSLLAQVNALTTLVPDASATDMRKGLVRRWAEHQHYRDRSTEWRPVNGPEASFTTKFEWEFDHKMHLQQSGTQLSAHRDYEIECSTHNELELPDVSMLSTGSLEIRVTGTMRLRMHSSRADSSWETESSVPWNVTIRIKGTVRGNVEVDIDGLDNLQPTPAKSVIRSGGVNVPNAQATLRHHLPRRQDFEGVLKELKVFQGEWRYYYPAATPFTLCTPMLNNDGDLLFELRRSQTELTQHSSRRRSYWGTQRSGSRTPATPSSAGGPRNGLIKKITDSEDKGDTSPPVSPTVTPSPPLDPPEQETEPQKPLSEDPYTDTPFD